MSQTVNLAAGTRLRLAREVVELAGAADVIFPNANSLDEVAEILAASNKDDILMQSNLRLNATKFDYQRVATATDAQTLGVPLNESIDVTHGPRGEKIQTSRGVPPVLVPATTTVEDAADTIIVATFDKDVNSAGNNYATGFSAKVNGVARVINAAARQVDNKVVKFTLASAVAPGHAVLLSYDQTAGDLKSDDGAKLRSFTDSVVTNNVA